MSIKVGDWVAFQVCHYTADGSIAPSGKPASDGWISPRFATKIPPPTRTGVEAMTNREELIEKMARAMMDADVERPGAFDSERWATRRPRYINLATDALAAHETHLAAKGWKITGPELDDGMIEAADAVTDGERLGLAAFGIDYWTAMHAASPDLLSEDADGK